MEKSWPKNINRLPAKQNVRAINIIKNILSSDHELEGGGRRIPPINMCVCIPFGNRNFGTSTSPL